MIINSLLDTDWYKLTMGQVVYFFYPHVKVKYKFIDRNNTVYPEGFIYNLKNEIQDLKNIFLNSEEKGWLSRNPNIYPAYLKWLNNYRFNPDEVKVTQDNKGRLNIVIEGDWVRTIYWEVPLLAIISELYFKYKLPASGTYTKMVNKRKIMQFPFADFGTRRRFSFNIQENLINIMRNSSYFLGTSNPFFAMKYDLRVIGTYAHEAVMACEILADSILNANYDWISKWKFIYGKQYNIALSDTLTTDFFLKQMDRLGADLLDGIRQDSGDPIEIGWKIVNRWRDLGVNPKTKKIVFSDNLNPGKAQKIYDVFKGITNPIFGIGTNLTNDCGHTPLNIVIKLDSVYNEEENKWYPVVKLSDDKGKYTGDIKTIKKVKEELKNVGVGL